MDSVTDKKSGRVNGISNSCETNQNGNISHQIYPELSRANIQNNQINPNKYQVWTIQKPILLRTDNVSSRNPDQILSISAVEVVHMPGIKTSGYVVEESKPLPKINVDKAKQLGVSPGSKYCAINNGLPVINNYGMRKVAPDEVLDGDSQMNATKLLVLVIYGRYPCL